MQEDYLSALPGELCDAIAANLDNQGVHNLRATCKTLHAKCDRQFAVHHFGVSTFMLTRKSLETLVAFSANSRFAPYIKELRIALTCFPSILKTSCGPDPLTHEEHQALHEIQQGSDGQTTESMSKAVLGSRKNLKRNRRRNYDRHMHDQCTIRKQGVDLQLLSDALGRLPRLETFTVLDRYDMKNMPWGCREVQIGFFPAWGPDGFAYMEEQLSIETREYFHDICAHAVSLALGALSGTKVQLTSLRMAHVPYNTIVAQDSSRSRCATPARTFSEEKFEGLGGVFSKLQEVSLGFYSAAGSDLSIINKPLLAWLPELIRFWESVQVLEIRGKNLEIDTYPFHLLATMVGKGAPLFPRLRALRVSHTKFHVAHLVELVENHTDSLEKLRVHNCDPVQAGFLALMDGLVGAHAMVSLELVEDRMVPLSRWALAGPSTMPRKLAGLKIAVLDIQKTDAVSFQQELRESIEYYDN
ncbi:hypothetical protein BCR34DRAFT_609149 [Clohesyomyces aquaticus]|uniref:F-box domain-containing protein n=1 Tax=Clohesyomyces aquaticus TaxID=1231657 RepID=A0A1Y1XWS6_9PLEO|nr:hypothetical protein BCR34DRAFT_609149 [Clohesyomyces aquaticus]